MMKARHAYGCTWDHGNDIHSLQAFTKLQASNAVKALLQVWLHSTWVLALAENLQQLIIWQEVEARECCALDF
jgi:hypothetical protein